MRSSFLDLVGPENVVKARKASRVVEALVFCGVMFGAGWIGGFWLRDNQAQVNRLNRQVEHQQEIKRLVDNYEITLRYLTGKIEQNAATVTNAAQTSEEAANTALKAATKADTAADKASTAARQSSAAVSRAERVPEPTRAQINRAVERANSSVGK